MLTRSPLQWRAVEPPALDALVPKFQESYKMKKDGHKVMTALWTCRFIFSPDMFNWSFDRCSYSSGLFLDPVVGISHSSFHRVRWFHEVDLLQHPLLTRVVELRIYEENFSMFYLCTVAAVCCSIASVGVRMCNRCFIWAAWYPTYPMWVCLEKAPADANLITAEHMHGDNINKLQLSNESHSGALFVAHLLVKCNYRSIQYHTQCVCACMWSSAGCRQDETEAATTPSKAGA